MYFKCEFYFIDLKHFYIFGKCFTSRLHKNTKCNKCILNVNSIQEFYFTDLKHFYIFGKCFTSRLHKNTKCNICILNMNPIQFYFIDLKHFYIYLESASLLDCTKIQKVIQWIFNLNFIQFYFTDSKHFYIFGKCLTSRLYKSMITINGEGMLLEILNTFKHVVV